MIPAKQTIMPGPGRPADSFRACLATLLDLTADRVPHYTMLEGWLDRYNEWLEEERGLALLELDWQKLGGVGPLPRRTMIIVSGVCNERPNFMHAVVAMTHGDYSWRYAHDPHPSQVFIQRARKVYLLVTTDPCQRR